MISNGGGGSGTGGGSSSSSRAVPIPSPTPPQDHTPPGSYTQKRLAKAAATNPTAGSSPSSSVASATISPSSSSGKPPKPGKASPGGGASGGAPIAASSRTSSPGPGASGTPTSAVVGAFGRISGGGGGGRTSGAGGGSGAALSGNSGGSSVEAALSRAGLVAVLDLCIALHKFVNVELHSQGWYAVRVRVVPDQDTVCTAHTVLQSNVGVGTGGHNHHQGQAMGGGQQEGQRQGQRGGARAAAAAGGSGGGAAADPPLAKQQGWVVEEGGSCFRSSVFRIRYCYEEVKMQTAVMMRVLVTNLQALPTLALHLEYELLFQEANLDNPAAVPEDFHLRCVARESVTLAGAASGLAEYYGCTFSDEHFGLCSSALFSGLAGFATKDLVESAFHRAVGSNWLCSLVGDSRRDAAQHYRPGPETPGATPSANSSPSSTSASRRASPSVSGGGGGGGGGSPGGLVAFGGAGGTSISRIASPPACCVDFSDQELRKKVIRLLHQVVEAPVVRQGTSHIPTEAERQERLVACYELLVESHCRSRDSLAAVLRAAPPECFAPQNLDVLRALLASATASASASLATASTPTSSPAKPATAGDGGSGGASGAAARAAASPLRNAAPRNAAAAPLARLSFGSTLAAANASGGGSAAAEGCAHADVPHVSVFRGQLRGIPTTAAALQQMDGHLVALSRDSQTDWAVLGWVLRTVPRELMRHLKLQWESLQPEAVMPFIVWDSASSRDAIAAKAAAHRQELRTPRFLLPAVQPGCLWGSPGDQPVLVVDDTLGVKWLEESDSYFGPDFRPREEAHVAIFVHGFQGASTDLCLVKAHLMLMFPYLECFSSKTNEGNTHDSIQEMGKRLAVEMAEVLAPFSRSSRRPLRKITLVGHSIGNLILRAALTQPEVQPYKHLLWLYISVCGPHLGFLYGTNAVVDTGLLLLKSIGKGKCLHQLTFSDAPQLTDCYLYRLAHECPLSVFKLVVVVSSPQDRYVPYHSSSITSCPQAERDSRRGRCYADMLRAVLAGVGQGTHLFRLAVDFSLRSKGFSFSKLVGRTAHIEFIESQLYVGLMMWGLVHRYTMLAPSPHSWL